MEADHDDSGNENEREILQNRNHEGTFKGMRKKQAFEDDNCFKLHTEEGGGDAYDTNMNALYLPLGSNSWGAGATLQ